METKTDLCLACGNGFHSPSSSAFEGTLFLGVLHGLGRTVFCNIGCFLATGVKHAREGAEDVEVESGL